MSSRTENKFTMISTFVPVALAAAAVLLPALVSSMPEHAKRYATTPTRSHNIIARRREAVRMMNVQI